MALVVLGLTELSSLIRGTVGARLFSFSCWLGAWGILDML
jgi:hypothetical protein